MIDMLKEYVGVLYRQRMISLRAWVVQSVENQASGSSPCSGIYVGLCSTVSSVAQYRQGPACPCCLWTRARCHATVNVMYIRVRLKAIARQKIQRQTTLCMTMRCQGWLQQEVNLV